MCSSAGHAGNGAARSLEVGSKKAKVDGGEGVGCSCILKRQGTRTKQIEAAAVPPLHRINLMCLAQTLRRQRQDARECSGGADGNHRQRTDAEYAGVAAKTKALAPGAAPTC